LGISSPHEFHRALLDGRRPLPLGDVIGLTLTLNYNLSYEYVLILLGVADNFYG
jgi:hypothetical protein